MTINRKTVYVCTACGKRSDDLYGDFALDRGWDESCLLNAVLAYTDALTITNGRVTDIADGGIVPEEPVAYPMVKELWKGEER